MKYKVVDHPGLYRDSSSKAIVSEDKISYQKYINDRKLLEKNKQLDNEINNMKSDIHEIKFLLHELLNKQANR